MRFVNRYGMRFVILVALTVMLYEVASIYFTCRHEDRISQAIRDHGGDTMFASQSWLSGLPFSRQLYSVEMCGFGRMATAATAGKPVESYSIPQSLLSELATLRGLRSLSLKKSTISDSDLERLRQLTYLKLLDLSETRTTPEGRGLLREHLPDCIITPAP